MPDNRVDSAFQKCLVVGTSSILAQQIVQLLLAAGHEVTGVFHRNPGPAAAGLTLVPVAALNELPDAFDVVFCISAYIPRKGEAPSPARLFEVNVALPEQLSARFSRAKLVYASSVSVYGQLPGVRTEASPCLQPNAYGLSKLWGEAVVQAHPRYAVLRISSMYGPGMHAETFLPLVVDAALKTRTITLLGDGSRQQNYIHAADAARAFVAAAAHPDNGVFLAVAERGYSNREVADLLVQHLPDVTVQHTGADFAPSFTYNPSLSFCTLNLPPARPLESGLADLILWNQKLS